jgi:predicted GIY-YIG superfamily endonuclease
MYFTYIIRSISYPRKTYIGFTTNIENRLKYHNQGRVPSTKNFVPWKVEFYAAFSDRLSAMRFEQYLKSASGKAFSSKHFGIR